MYKLIITKNFIVMALENLISIDFTQEEQEALDKACATIENVLTKKVVNLTPDQRQLYARVNNETENWVTKTRDYMHQKPELVPFYLDVKEFDKDLAARRVFTPLENRISSILESISDSNILLGNDVYHSAISFYRNVKNASKENVPGTTHIYNDLAEQFPGQPKTVKTEVPQE
jgi:hypothetical protein